jgi:hypothetical protein
MADGSSSSEGDSGTTGPGDLPECDGPIAASASATIDRSAIGTGDDVELTAMAVNAAGETVIVGQHTAALTIGDVMLPGSEVATTGFAAKYDAELQLSWARQLELPGKLVAFDGGGDITIGSEQAVHRLDGESGDERWSVDRIPFTLTTLPGGDVVMATFTPNSDDEIIRFAGADGSVVWNVKVAPSPDLALPDQIAVTDDGGFFWLGEVMGTIHTQSGDLAAGSDFQLDTVLVRYDGDGVALWGRVLSDVGYIGFPELALDDCGIYLGGDSSAFGDDGLQHDHAELIRLDMAGALVWRADLMLDDFTSQIEAITTDADGNVVIVGNGEGTIAGKPLDYATGFVAQLNRDGDLLWVETLGTGISPAVGVGYLPDGGVRIGAWSYGNALAIQGQTILDQNGMAVADFAIAAE